MEAFICPSLPPHPCPAQRPEWGLGRGRGDPSRLSETAPGEVRGLHRDCLPSPDFSDGAYRSGCLKPRGSTCPHTDKGQAQVGSQHTTHGQSRAHTTGTQGHTDISETMQAHTSQAPSDTDPPRRNPVHTHNDTDIQHAQKPWSHTAQHTL